MLLPRLPAIVPGLPWQAAATLRSSLDHAPINLSGASVTAELRRLDGSGAVASLIASVPAPGTILLDLDPSGTVALPRGPLQAVATIRLGGDEAVIPLGRAVVAPAR